MRALHLRIDLVARLLLGDQVSCEKGLNAAAKPEPHAVVRVLPDSAPRRTFTVNSTRPPASGQRQPSTLAATSVLTVTPISEASVKAAVLPGWAHDATIVLVMAPGERGGIDRLLTRERRHELRGDFGAVETMADHLTLDGSRFLTEV